MTWLKQLLPDITLPPKSGKPLFALSLAAWLMTFGGGVLFPVFPEMVEDLALSPEQAGFFASAFTLTGALCTPFLALLSNRIGHGRLMVVSLVGFGLLGVAPAFFSSFEAILAARLLLGIAKAGVTAALLAILVTLLSGIARTNVLGYATGFMTLSGIATYLLAGLAGSGDWRHAFFVFLLALPVAGFAHMALSGTAAATKPAERPAHQRSSLWSTLGHGPLLLFLAAIPVVSGGAQILRVYGPLHLKALFDSGPETNGVLLAIMALGAVLVSALLSGRVARRIGRGPTIALGLALMGLSLAALLSASGLSLSGLCFFAVGAGFGLAMPTLFDALANHAEDHQKTTVMALGSSVNGLGLFLAPVVMGSVWAAFGFEAVFFSAAAVALCAALLLVWVRPSAAPDR
ncbi:MAG: MFS transporter [Rhodospirillaceae bacterium]